MIQNRSFTHSWVSAVNEQQGWGRSDAQLKNLEKATMALHLLEQLSLTGLPFIFKGGTALLLLLQKIYRFSIDIDILLTPSTDGQTILSTLNEVVKLSPYFDSYEEDSRRSTEHFSHFRFVYHPFVEPITDTPPPYILLDITRTDNPYSRLERLPIRTGLVDTAAPDTLVSIPSINCLLADKLTAFAPETTGVPITAEPGIRPKRVEALKQLFDVSNLFPFCNDVREIQETYLRVATQEIQARRLTISPADALSDTLRYALLLGSRGGRDSSLYNQLAKGIPEFRRFVANQSFSEVDAARCAGKAAYLVRLIRENEKQHINHFTAGVDMSDWDIPQKEYEDINLLKMIDPEAFFYWYQTLV